MKISNNTTFLFIGLGALFTGQIFMVLLVAFLWCVWEDAKWPAFDSEDYDRKMMKGPLSPWNKAN